MRYRLSASQEGLWLREVSLVNLWII